MRVFLIWSVAVEIPAGSHGLLVEGSQVDCLTSSEMAMSLWHDWIAEIEELKKRGRRKLN